MSKALQHKVCIMFVIIGQVVRQCTPRVPNWRFAVAAGPQCTQGHSAHRATVPGWVFARTRAGWCSAQGTHPLETADCFRKRSAVTWLVPETIPSYMAGSGNDAQLHGWFRKRCPVTWLVPETMPSYMAGSGNDAQLHGWFRKRCPVTWLVPETMPSYMAGFGNDAQLHGWFRKRCPVTWLVPETTPSYMAGSGRASDLCVLFHTA